MAFPVAVAGWPNHAETFMSHIDVYKTKNLFCDCTLACDRKLFRAHKMILAISSELFESIFLSTEDKNPVIILHEIEAWQIECLLEYMYRGETQVSDSHFVSLCRAAKSLQIKGFDKLELYREAVKQSGKNDSRLIAKNVCESHEEGSKIRSDEVESKRDSFPEESERNGSSCHPSSPPNAQEGSKLAHFPQSPQQSQNLGANFHPPGSYFSKDSFLSPVQDLSLKASHQNETHKPDDLQTSGSFSKRCNYNSSPSFNFKKNYLLATSLSPPPQTSPDNLRTPDKASIPSPTYPGVKIESQESQILASTADHNSVHEGQESGQQADFVKKTLRGPPPLLRIVYGHPSEKTGVKLKPENTTPHFKFETRDRYPGEISPYHQTLQNCFQLAFNPEPGNDPLLQKIPTNKRKRVRGPKSWEFLLRLLRSPESNPSLIKWENEKAGVFRLIRPDVIALRWGRRTGKHVYDTLSYESFSRGLRYHYATGALCAVSEKSFVYQFGPKAQSALQASSPAKDSASALINH